MLQHIATSILTAAFVGVLVLWSTRSVNPFWPAFVFALARSGVSFATGATALTAVATAVAALALGLLYFWVLQRLQGRRVWWIVLVIGLVLFSV